MNSENIIQYVDKVGDAMPITDNFNLAFWVLMGLNLIIIAIVRTTTPGYINALFDTALHNRQLINNLREELNFKRLPAILLNLTYINAVSVIIWMATTQLENTWIYSIALILLASAIVKLLIIRLTVILTNTRIGLQEHFLNHFIFFQVGGIILTPILIFTHYIPASYVNLLLIVLTIIVALLITVRELQSLVRAIQYNISIFYIILYLCTLEIIPLLVGFRVILQDSEILN
ncbi:DUF4271 domain-containing protein [Crocinitomix algicola]|uniref:DUF4271 domain-containing protein n=1 Tax=Crocinitomix algicola TaxID=1740263 RepID=UPI00082DE7EC|nr:DUF4271 domain-containing protein [Crocinitomix algicola]